MNPKQPFVLDDAEVDRMLKELRMPTMKDMWRPFAERAQRELGAEAPGGAPRPGPRSGDPAASQVPPRRPRRHRLRRSVPGSASSPTRPKTIAAVDRLVHHAHILTLKGESYRRQAAVERAANAAGTDDKK